MEAGEGAEGGVVRFGDERAGGIRMEAGDDGVLVEGDVLSDGPAGQ